MTQAITIKCEDTGKTITTSVSETLYQTAITHVKTEESWDAYLEIQAELEKFCLAQGVTFWTSNTSNHYWCSEL